MNISFIRDTVSSLEVILHVGNKKDCVISLCDLFIRIVFFSSRRMKVIPTAISQV